MNVESHPALVGVNTRPLGMPVLLACALGIALAYTGRPPAVAAAAATGVGYLMFMLAAVRNPLILAAAMLLILETLPPFYFDTLGETPLYISFLLLPIAVAVFVLRFPDMRFSWDPVAKGMAAFLAGTALSLPFAFWLSGAQVGLHSLERWLLLGHAPLVYWLIRAGARKDPCPTERNMYRLLVLGAVFAAIYGIVDFLWPIPLPHPAADQFIWLEGTVIRRAQGPFYESSSFANFCGFFLVASATAWLGRRERCLGVSRFLLPVLASVLSLAVLLAFSRSVWASVLCALGVAVIVSPFLTLPRGLTVGIALVIPIGLVWALSPELWDYLVGARLRSLFDIVGDPNAATSGRFETWIDVLAIMRGDPQYLIFGIGYKSLEVTRLFRQEIITDNGFLSLLLETGIVGLSGFFMLSTAIFRVFLNLARSRHVLPAFWGSVLLAIWCGELVLFLAADAYTYWRNITVLAAMMALTLNVGERAKRPGTD